MRISKSEREKQKQEAVEYLRYHLPAGSTVYTLVSSVSRSGMSRNIKCLRVSREKSQLVVDCSWYVARALGWKYIEDPTRSVRVNGCGMDIALHLVTTLSWVMYGKSGELGQASL